MNKDTMEIYRNLHVFILNFNGNLQFLYKALLLSSHDSSIGACLKHSLEKEAN